MTTRSKSGEESPLQMGKDIGQDMSEKSSNPSEELNDHPAPNFSQEKVGTFLDYDSSNTQARKTFVVQSPSHSIEKPDQQQCRRDKHELEHSIYKGFPSEQSLVANGKEEDRRDGKQWRCSQMVSPGNQYCQKHQLYMVARNERRRKGPSRGQRCRRNGKGWRCHEMVVLGKIYCEKHVLAQSIRNAKRRKGAPRGQHFWVDGPQCGHTEESHRCSQMRLQGNIYCVKHQLEQSINNERSRTSQREESPLVAGDHSTGLKKKKVNNKLQCSQKTVAFRCPPLSISGPSADEIIRQKEEVGKHKTTTLERTVGQSEELVSGKSAEGLEHEATCIEITDAMQIECIVEETEIRVKETCNKSEYMQPLSMLLDDSSPTRMNISYSGGAILKLAELENFERTSY
ncbi:hypothetical protein IFM89_010620 [Coptis chinensis]|uniref:WRC domain-containing protein n=1 Tax=Coptis chinensis TaxID=261450 RepID=A0A835MAN8_9MAGN|nr:hypothetical protein IFM89_010620 [Coptis chinensis]